MGVVEEAVEHGGGGRRIAEKFAPVLDGSVRRNLPTAPAAVGDRGSLETQ
jgi:hypothetical protein